MPTIANLVVELEANTSKFNSGIANAGRTLTKGLTLPIAAGFAIAAKEAVEFNQVNAQTAAALKSTQGAANVTQRDVQNLAAEIGELTAQDAELVQESTNILLTFTKIRNEVGKGNDVFDQAQLAVANLSARLGKDLNSSAILVGKALNNPIAGLSALSRVGIQFDEQQKKMIARMVESGRALEAQKVILAELEKQFGGSAKAAGDTASPLQKLTVAALDLAESIGKIVLPVVENLAGIATRLANSFGDLSPVMQRVVVIGASLAAALGPLLIIVGKLVGAWRLLTGQKVAYTAATARATAATGAETSAMGAGIAKVSAYAGAIASVAVAAKEVWDFARQDRGFAEVLNAQLEKGVVTLDRYKQQVESVTNKQNVFIDALDGDTDIWQAYNRAVELSQQRMSNLVATLGLMDSEFAAVSSAIAGHTNITEKQKRVMLGNLAVLNQNNVVLSDSEQATINAYIAAGHFSSAQALLGRIVKREVLRPLDQLKANVDQVGGAMRGAETRAQLYNRELNRIPKNKHTRVTADISQAREALNTLLGLLRQVSGGAAIAVRAGINSVPQLHDGGYVSQTGLAVVHRGETFSGVNNNYTTTRTPNRIDIRLDRRHYAGAFAYDQTFRGW